MTKKRKSDNLAAALRYAEFGYRVFPCVPNEKRPLTARGLKDATTDPEQIEAWWTKWPDANVAIATDGLLVVDVDCFDGQKNTWLEDEPDKLLDLAAGPISITPRGGKHFLFCQPANLGLRNTNSKLAAHVDTRADGGYVLAAPSIVDGKAYQWVQALDVPLERLPEPPTWLLEMLLAKPASDESVRSNNSQDASAICEGKRNSALASLGGSMRRIGMSGNEILAALLTANADRCQPPLDRNEVETIGKSVSRYKPDHIGNEAERNRSPIHRPVITKLSDVQPEDVQWLWPGRIALGKLTLLAGDPGLGKSFLTLDLAARVSLGKPWPDCPHIAAPCGGVVLLNAEDALGDTVRPRLDAMGADVGRIVALEAVQGVDRMQINLQRDLPAVEQAIEQTPDCRLVVIDPISAYLGKVDSHNNADIRALLHPLADLANRHKVAVLAVTHLNKGNGNSALYRTTGSLAFVAAARATWLVAKDPNDPPRRRRFFMSAKNNLAGDTLGMAFVIDDGVLQWEPDQVVIDADSILAGYSAQQDDNDSVQWLRQALANGPLDASDIQERAKANGISAKRLWKAKRTLKIESTKTGFDGHWQWALPLEDYQESLPSGEATLGIFGESSANPPREDSLDAPPTCAA